LERRGAYRVLMGKSKGEIPLERPNRGWEDNIKMDNKGIGWESVDWIVPVEDVDKWQGVVKKGDELSGFLAR
jgi:hypothetical protein